MLTETYIYVLKTIYSFVLKQLTDLCLETADNYYEFMARNSSCALDYLCEG